MDERIRAEPMDRHRPARDLQTARPVFSTRCARTATRSEPRSWCSADGCWSKHAELYRDIQGTTLDALILKPGLTQEIESDLDRFIGAQDFYERYGVPWKRGLLLVGPPGNGKTHCVKGIVNRFGLPCLYVRSFNDRYGSPEGNVQSVFRRARRSAPCFLVLEDLEALVTKRIRAYFLNELDGFAANQGIITIGTTNYPERLDPAPLRATEADSTSNTTSTCRPNPSGRRYLAAWSDRLDPEVRPSPETIADLARGTSEFSFAFLKELTLSSLVDWASQSGAQRIDELLMLRAERLRPQLHTDPPMRSVPRTDDDDSDEENDEDDED